MHALGRDRQRTERRCALSAELDEEGRCTLSAELKKEREKGEKRCTLSAELDKEREKKRREEMHTLDRAREEERREEMHALGRARGGEEDDARTHEDARKPRENVLLKKDRSELRQPDWSCDRGDVDSL